MDELVEQLESKRSPKRRSAARRLRKLGNVEAGPYLLKALRNELKDVRTWETQYQMIMAIGECGYKESLPFIKEIAARNFEASMIYIAIGDAIVRLSIKNKDDATPVIDLIASGNEMQISGALRAMAMLRMVPSDDQISEIITFASTYAIDEGMRFWVIAAAPGWSGSKVERYLEESERSTRDVFRTAVELAKKKKYKKWKPL